MVVYNSSNRNISKHRVQKYHGYIIVGHGEGIITIFDALSCAVIRSWVANAQCGEITCLAIQEGGDDVAERSLGEELIVSSSVDTFDDAAYKTTEKTTRNQDSDRFSDISPLHSDTTLNSKTKTTASTSKARVVYLLSTSAVDCDSITVWDFYTGNALRKLNCGGHKYFISSISVLCVPRGVSILQQGNVSSRFVVISASFDVVGCMMSIEDDTVLHRVIPSQPAQGGLVTALYTSNIGGGVSSMESNTSGKLLYAVATWDQQVLLFDLSSANGNMLFRFEGSSSLVSPLGGEGLKSLGVFQSVVDGEVCNLMITGYGDGRASIWSGEHPVALRHVADSSGRAISSVFLQFPRCIQPRTVKRRFKHSRQLENTSSSNTTVISDDDVSVAVLATFPHLRGAIALTGNTDGVINIWNAELGILLRILTTSFSSPVKTLSVDISGDGGAGGRNSIYGAHFVVHAALTSGQVCIWDLTAGCKSQLPSADKAGCCSDVLTTSQVHTNNNTSNDEDSETTPATKEVVTKLW